MSATISQRVAKAGSAFAEKVRNASITTKGSELEHGREIYAHSHLQTNQVVYSLQKHMKVIYMLAISLAFLGTGA